MLPQRIYKRVAVIKREVTKEKRSVSEIIEENFCDQKRLNGTLRAKKKVVKTRAGELTFGRSSPGAERQ